MADEDGNTIRIDHENFGACRRASFDEAVDVRVLKAVADDHEAGRRRRQSDSEAIEGRV